LIGEASNADNFNFLVTFTEASAFSSALKNNLAEVPS
jgi:hypothetical protein